MKESNTPGLKAFFIKILNSIVWVLIWIMSGVTGGIYFKLGFTNGKPVMYTILFYTVMVVTLFFLISYLYKNWKNG